MKLEKEDYANIIILTLLILSVLGIFACLFIGSETAKKVGLILVGVVPFLLYVGAVKTIAVIYCTEEGNAKIPVDEHQISIDFKQDECEKISHELVLNEKNKRFEEEYYIESLTLVPIKSSNASGETNRLIRYAFVDSENNPIFWLNESTSKTLHDVATKYRLKKVDYDFYNKLSLIFDTSRQPKDDSGKLSFTLVEDWTNGLGLNTKGLIPNEKVSES